MFKYIDVTNWTEEQITNWNKLFAADPIRGRITCEECKYFHIHGNKTLSCDCPDINIPWYIVKPDNFCCWAEPKEGESDE
jgi:hypothetical protein